VTIPLGDSITFRLPLDVEANLRSAAEAAGLTFGVFIRKRLCAMSLLDEEIANLRSVVETLATSGGGYSPQDAALLVETLMLLRVSSRPEHLRTAQAEVIRQGLAVWSGDSPDAPRR